MRVVLLVVVVRPRGCWHIIAGLWDSCWQGRFTVFSPFGFNSSFQADRSSMPSPTPSHLLPTLTAPSITPPLILHWP